MAVKLLLLEDVEDLGRSGDVVNVKPGYARNFLLPRRFAVLAHKGALRMQERLRLERQKKAAEDKQEAEKLAAELSKITLSIIVKVDHEGHMYGSVTAVDVLKILQEQHQAIIEKRAIQLKQPIKTTGIHEILIKLKEGISATVTLKVEPEEASGIFVAAPTEGTEETE